MLLLLLVVVPAVVVVKLVGCCCCCWCCCDNGVPVLQVVLSVLLAGLWKVYGFTELHTPWKFT